MNRMPRIQDDPSLVIVQEAIKDNDEATGALARFVSRVHAEMTDLLDAGYVASSCPVCQEPVTMVCGKGHEGPR